MNNRTSSSEVVRADTAQVSIDGPLLFNLFIKCLILSLYTTALSNYADDNNFMISVIIKTKLKEHLSKTFWQ